MTNSLDEFIAEAEHNSPYVTFIDGEEVVGLYRGAKVVEDTFNKGEQTIEYTLEVDDVEKTFKSRSIKLARQINKFKNGDKVQLVKTGTAFDTEWYVEEAK